MTDQNRERRCSVCLHLLPVDAFPPDSKVCERCYELAGVDAWEASDD